MDTQRQSRATAQHPVPVEPEPLTTPSPLPEPPVPVPAEPDPTPPIPEPLPEPRMPVPEVPPLTPVGSAAHEGTRRIAEERAMNRMVNLVRAAGIDTAGTTSDQQAMSYLETGTVGAVVVAGSVMGTARRALSSEANGAVSLIHAALRGTESTLRRNWSRSFGTECASPRQPISRTSPDRRVAKTLTIGTFGDVAQW